MTLFEPARDPVAYFPIGAVEQEMLQRSDHEIPHQDLGKMYRAPFEEVARIADLVSFYPEKVTITVDGETLEPAPGQNVISHGPDRNLGADEIGGIALGEGAAAAEA